MGVAHKNGPSANRGACLPVLNCRYRTKQGTDIMPDGVRGVERFGIGRPPGPCGGAGLAVQLDQALRVTWNQRGWKRSCWATGVIARIQLWILRAPGSVRW